MALKPIGIEDDNTFPGRVGTALTTHAQNAVADALAGKSDTGHTHDDRYYTEAEVNTSLGGKVDKSSLVYLTQAQYDALATKDSSTTYFITG